MITANEMSVIRSIIRTEMNNQRDINKDTNALNRMRENKNFNLNLQLKNESPLGYKINDPDTRNMLAG